MRDRRRLLLPLLLLAGAVAAGCKREPAVPANAEALYRHYCASCHGIDGRGDGPAAAALDPRPSDLTKTDLSLAELMKVIDGRRTVRAHGDAAMPVWGPVFEAAADDKAREHRTALLQVQAVAEYVRAMAKKDGLPERSGTPGS